MTKVTILSEEQPASLATIDPLANLAAHVLEQAIRDLSGGDVVQLVDALAFWLSDAPALWLSALGIVGDEIDSDKVFRDAITRGIGVNDMDDLHQVLTVAVQELKPRQLKHFRKALVSNLCAAVQAAVEAAEQVGKDVCTQTHPKSGRGEGGQKSFDFGVSEQMGPPRERKRE